jgi:hypothetical protein
MPGEAYGSIDALYGSDCAHDGCTLLVGDFSTTRHVLTRVTEPAEELRTSEPLRVTAVRADGERWAVTFPAPEHVQFPCSGLYDRPTDTVVGRSCETTVQTFSPDGRHLTGARGDNQMWGSIEILDASFDLAQTYESGSDHVIKDWGWADADHLLVSVATLRGANEWTLLRVPIDGGEPEVVSGPVSGPSSDWPSVFHISD